MAEVYELSDRVSVLRDGTYVGTLDRRRASRADALVKMMVGRDLSSFYKKEHDPHGSRGPVILEVKGVTDGGRRVKPCSFQLHAGRGAGHRRAGRLGPHRAGAADLRRRSQGRRRGPARRPARSTSSSPRTRSTAGIAYLTEDRKRLGLFLDMSCGENINVGVIDRDARGWRRAQPRARPSERARGRVQGAARPGGEPAGRRRQPVGRQPAEGAAVALAGDRARRC